MKNYKLWGKICRFTSITTCWLVLILLGKWGLPSGKAWTIWGMVLVIYYLACLEMRCHFKSKIDDLAKINHGLIEQLKDDNNVARKPGYVDPRTECTICRNRAYFTGEGYECDFNPNHRGDRNKHFIDISGSKPLTCTCGRIYDLPANRNLSIDCVCGIKHNF